MQLPTTSVSSPDITSTHVSTEKKFSTICTAIVRNMSIHVLSIDTLMTPGFPKYTICAKADTQFMQAPIRMKSIFNTQNLDYPSGKIISNVTNITNISCKLLSNECDFALAISLLAAHHKIGSIVEGCAFIGGLSLTGVVLESSGILAIINALRMEGVRYIFLSATLMPYLSRYQLWEGVALVPVKTLAQAWNILIYVNSYQNMNNLTLPMEDMNTNKKCISSPESCDNPHTSNESYIRVEEKYWAQSTYHAILNQQEAHQQLIYSAIGGHSVFLYGSSGVGKTELAQSLINILPDLESDQVLYRDMYRDLLSESFSEQERGTREKENFFRPTFIKPWRKLSSARLYGTIKPEFTPGLVHLAAQGVLFLDECTFIPPAVLESLRVFIDEQHNYHNYGEENSYAHFPLCQLVLAANVCACAAAYDSECLCSSIEKRKYRAKISQALLDRIDIHIPLMPVVSGILNTNTNIDASEGVMDHKNPTTNYGRNRGVLYDTCLDGNNILRESIAAARERSVMRWEKRILNSQVPDDLLYQHTQLSAGDKKFLHTQIREHKFSLRSYSKILTLAWSIADWEGINHINRTHLAAAIEMREPW